MITNDDEPPSQSKKPYKELTLVEKVELIRLAESQPSLSQAAIAEKYEIAKSNVCRILQRRQEYLDAYASDCYGAHRKRKLRPVSTTPASKQAKNEDAGNDNLRAHMYKMHQISRMFMCRCCNWAFPDKTSLHVHVQNMQAHGKTSSPPELNNNNNNNSSPIKSAALLCALQQNQQAQISTYDATQNELLMKLRNPMLINPLAALIQQAISQQRQSIEHSGDMPQALKLEPNMQKVQKEEPTSSSEVIKLSAIDANNNEGNRATSSIAKDDDEEDGTLVVDVEEDDKDPNNNNAINLSMKQNNNLPNIPSTVSSSSPLHALMYRKEDMHQPWSDATSTNLSPASPSSRTVNPAFAAALVRLSMANMVQPQGQSQNGSQYTPDQSSERCSSLSISPPHNLPVPHAHQNVVPPVPAQLMVATTHTGNQNCFECQLLKARIALTDNRCKYLENKTTSLQGEISRLKSRIQSMTSSTRKGDDQVRMESHARLLACQERAMRYLQQSQTTGDQEAQRLIAEILHATLSA